MPIVRQHQTETLLPEVIQSPKIPPMEWDWLKSSLILNLENGRLVIRTDAEAPGVEPVSSFARIANEGTSETSPTRTSFASENFPSPGLVACLARFQARADFRRKEARKHGCLLPSQKKANAVIRNNSAREIPQKAPDEIFSEIPEPVFPKTQLPTHQTPEKPIKPADLPKDQNSFSTNGRPVNETSAHICPKTSIQNNEPACATKGFAGLLATLRARKNLREKSAAKYGVVLPSNRIKDSAPSSPAIEENSSATFFTAPKMATPAKSTFPATPESVSKGPPQKNELGVTEQPSSLNELQKRNISNTDPSGKTTTSPKSYTVPFEYREKKALSKNKSKEPLELKSGKMTSLLFEITEPQ